MRTHYRIDDFQESYFVIHDLDELLDFTRVDFAPLYQRALAGLEHQPGDVLPGDTVFHRGDGSYHRSRR
jgi:phenylalanine-4-hydroxylase